MSLVQTTKSTDTNDAGATSVATSAFASAPTAGNVITGHVSWNGTGTTELTSVTDGTNTYTIVDSIFGANNIACATFVAQNISGGTALTVTANFSATVAFRRISAQEWSSVATTGQPNAHAINHSTTFGTGTDAVTSTAATTTADGCTVVGFSYDDSSATVPSVGTGYTSVDSATFGAGDAFRVESKSQTTQGSVAATFTTTAGTDSIFAAVLALAPATSAFVEEDSSTWPVPLRDNTPVVSVW